MKKNEYEIHGMAVTPFGVAIYCFNDKLISMEEFVLMEYEAQLKSMEKKEIIFKVLKSDALLKFAVGLN